MDGMEVLAKIEEMHPEIPVLMISGHGNIDTAVEAIKKGAYDFIEKPLDLNRLFGYHSQCAGAERPGS
jgi:DNA-binding NtrC family response regulator